MKAIPTAILALTISLPWQAVAQTQPPGEPDKGAASQAEPNSTRDVLTKMHRINEMEIRVGRMAKEKGHKAEVRAYGSRLVRDHTFADTRVLRLAKREGITLPPPGSMPAQDREAAEKQRKTEEKLREASGSAFDQIFLSAMVTGHEEAVRTLSQVEQTTTDAKLRELLGKLIPILKQHLDVAKNLGGRSEATAMR